MIFQKMMILFYLIPEGLIPSKIGLTSCLSTLYNIIDTEIRINCYKNKNLNYKVIIKNNNNSVPHGHFKKSSFL